MRLWKYLYITVWLAFFACVLVPRWMGAAVGLPVHIILGLSFLTVTVSNARKLAALPVPVRLKRIGKVTMGFAIFQLVTGLALGGFRHLDPDLPLLASIVHGVHAVVALAILAQASSVATAYDMWEEKEFQNGGGR
jgi:membrane protease YdiL (CAAX protease family)